MKMRASIRKVAIHALLALTLAAATALAEKRYGPGVTDTEIKIGQTMPYSGALSVYGQIGRTQLAYFAKINAEGGINGRKIKLISLDDGYSPPKALEQARRLVARHSPGDPCWLMAGSGYLEYEPLETTIAGLEEALSRADAAVTVLLPAAS